MKRFVIRVTEIHTVDYTIDAENETAARKAAVEWIDRNSETVANDLSKDWYGWDVDVLGTEEMDGYPADMTEGDDK